MNAIPQSIDTGSKRWLTILAVAAAASIVVVAYSFVQTLAPRNRASWRQRNRLQHPPGRRSQAASRIGMPPRSHRVLKPLLPEWIRSLPSTPPLPPTIRLCINEKFTARRTTSATSFLKASSRRGPVLPVGSRCSNHPSDLSILVVPSSRWLPGVFGLIRNSRCGSMQCHVHKFLIIMGDRSTNLVNNYY